MAAMDESQLLPLPGDPYDEAVAPQDSEGDPQYGEVLQERDSPKGASPPPGAVLPTGVEQLPNGDDVPTASLSEGPAVALTGVPAVWGSAV